MLGGASFSRVNNDMMLHRLAYPAHVFRVRTLTFGYSACHCQPRKVPAEGTAEGKLLIQEHLGRRARASRFVLCWSGSSSGHSSLSQTPILDYRQDG